MKSHYQQKFRGEDPNMVLFPLELAGFLSVSSNRINKLQMHIKYTYITWLDCLFLWILVVQTVVGSVFAHIDYRDNMNHNAKRYWGDKVRKLTVVCLMNNIRLKLK